jgi:hypothetical protein
MNTRDRWLVSLGFDAGWDAHAAYVETAPDPTDPTDLRVPSFGRVPSHDWTEEEMGS